MSTSGFLPIFWFSAPRLLRRQRRYVLWAWRVYLIGVLEVFEAVSTTHIPDGESGAPFFEKMLSPLTSWNVLFDIRRKIYMTRGDRHCRSGLVQIIRLTLWAFKSPTTIKHGNQFEVVNGGSWLSLVLLINGSGLVAFCHKILNQAISDFAWFRPNWSIQ